jgi:hypothetical protein
MKTSGRSRRPEKLRPISEHNASRGSEDIMKYREIKRK